MANLAVIFLADGFEETEAVVPMDFLRRAGIRTTLVAVENKQVKSSHKLVVQADAFLDELGNIENDFDIFILPGGMPGATNLAEDKRIGDILKNANKAGKLIAAICASPAVVLSPLGIIDNKRVTCYPGCETDFPKSAKYENKKVVVDGNVITSQGPGTAFDFAQAITEKVLGKEVARKIASMMLAERK